MNGKPADPRSEALPLTAEAPDVLAVDPADVDRAWGEETVRRSQQITSGEVKTLSWSEVLEQVAANRKSR